MEKRGVNNTYWGNLKEGFQSLKLGMKISWRHFKVALVKKNHKPIAISDKEYVNQASDGGIVTLEYPAQTFPVPDNGRYRLHNEIEDCIVCDKCANICPVNCIDITAIKSPGEIRKASDGSSVRLYAETFDIDMAKCCFCGLCTTVCPTECLTMTKTYDFSEFDVTNMNYHFTELSPEQAEEKKKEYEQFQAEKKAKTATKSTTGDTKAANPKPKIGGAKPVIKRPVPKIPKKKDSE